MPDKSPFPFVGGSLCEPKDTADVGCDVTVIVGRGKIVALGVGVNITILDVGLGCGRGMEVGREVGMGVGDGVQLQTTVLGITPPCPEKRKEVFVQGILEIVTHV